MKPDFCSFPGMKLYLGALAISVLCWSHAAQAETFDQKLEKIRNRPDFVYGADPEYLNSSFAIFKAMNSVLEAIKKNEKFGKKKIKDVTISRRGSEFQIWLAPYDAYDLLNVLKVPILDETYIYATVDSKTYEVKNLDLCGKCGIPFQLPWPKGMKHPPVR